MASLRQQQLQILALEIADESVVLAQDGVGERALGLLQLDHFLFHGVAAKLHLGRIGRRGS